MMLAERSLKTRLLDEYRHYEEIANILRQAYYAAKYNDWKNCLHWLTSAECSGMSEKRYYYFKESIEKEMQK